MAFDIQKTTDLLLSGIKTIAPDADAVKKEIDELIAKHPTVPPTQLANWFANRSRRLYTAAGVASALPSVIPGLGTAAQIGVEAGSVIGDLFYMIRHMARLSLGIAVIYGHDVHGFDVQEFLRILGYWCGALKVVGDAAARVGTKAAIVQVNKHVSRQLIKKINQKVGFTLVTKYGSKRGFVALGKIIPFGVGAIIGGSFNYATMTGFKRAAISYFSDSPGLCMEAE